MDVFRIISVKDIRQLLIPLKETRLISQLKYHSCWYNLPYAAITLLIHINLISRTEKKKEKKMD